LIAIIFFCSLAAASLRAFFSSIVLDLSTAASFAAYKAFL
jgi:hypothetical protein